MYNSLEVRSPLINHNIYNFVTQIPINQLINNGEMKSILKDILKKYLPKHLINTTKRGFSVPISDWLRRLATTFFILKYNRAYENRN